MQAAGAAKSSLLINISRQGLIFMPMVFILGSAYEKMGLVWAQPVADISSFILACILYMLLSKNLFREDENLNLQEGKRATV